MTRAGGLGVGAAVALAAWVQVPDRTRPWQVSPGRVFAEARSALADWTRPSSKVAPVEAVPPAPTQAPADEPALASPEVGDALSFPGLDFDTGILASGTGEEWRALLGRLDDVSAGCDALSLDALLDLDLGVSEDVQVARPSILTEPTFEVRVDPTIAVARGETSATAVVVAQSEVRQASSVGATEATSARHVASPQATDTSHPHVRMADSTPIVDRHDPHVTASRDVLFPPHPAPDKPPPPGRVPGPFAGQDVPPGSGPHLASVARSPETWTRSLGPGERLAAHVETGSPPQDHPREQADDADGDLENSLDATCEDEGSREKAMVCHLRHLVAARQRLLDDAPASAFADRNSRVRVRSRLRRALRAIDRALTRADDTTTGNDPARARLVGRGIVAYETRLRSRGVEDALVDPALTRALHFPVGGLGHWR